MLSTLIGSYKPHAKVVSNRLVLSLPDAQEPVLWSVELEQEKSVVLKLDTSKDGVFSLVRDNGKATPTIIASYDKKGPAMTALMKATKALNKARSGQGQRGWLTTTLAILGVVFIISSIGISAYIYNGFSKRHDGQAPQSTASVPQQQETVPQLKEPFNPNTTGVPLSADDFFNSKLR